MKKIIAGVAFLFLSTMVVFGQVATDPNSKSTGKHRFTFGNKDPHIYKAKEEGETCYYVFSNDKAKNASLIEVKKYDKYGKILYSTEKAVSKKDKKHTVYFNTELGVITIYVGLSGSYKPTGQGEVILDTQLKDIDISKDAAQSIPSVAEDRQHWDLMDNRSIERWYRVEDAFVITNDNAQLGEPVTGAYNSLKIRRFLPNINVVTSAIESSYKALWVFDFEKAFDIIEKVKASIYAIVIGATDTDVISYTRAWNDKGFNQHHICYNDMASGQLNFRVTLDERYSMQKYHFDGEKLFIVGDYGDGVNDNNPLSRESKGIYFAQVDDRGNITKKEVGLPDNFRDASLINRFEKNELQYHRFFADETTKLGNGSYLVIGEYRALYKRKHGAEWWFTNMYGYYIVDEELNIVSENFVKVKDDLANTNGRGEQIFSDYFFDESTNELVVLYAYPSYSADVGLILEGSQYAVNIDKETVIKVKDKGNFNSDCLCQNEEYHFIDAHSMLFFKYDDINNIQVKQLD